MFQQKLQQVIEQPKQAVIGVVLLSILPFLHWFALLLTLMVTLRKGWRDGLILVVIAVVIDGLLSKFVMHYPDSQVLLQVVNPVLLWLLAWTLRETVSWRMVLQLLTLIGILLVVLIYSLFPETAQSWSQQLVVAMQQIAGDRPSLISGINADEWKHLVQVFGQFATGLRVLLFSAMGLVSLVMARYMQAAIYNPGGLKQEFYHWHLNVISGLVILILSAIAGFLQTPVWLSITPVLMLPVLCVGLSLLHCLTARYKHQFWILLIFYVCVASVVPQLLFLVILLGWLDCFFNFRQRIIKK